jgi:hypothetical protein
MDIKKVTNLLVGTLGETDDYSKTAAIISVRYRLPNPLYLENILSVVGAFRYFHSDVERADQSTKKKLREIRRALRTIESAVTRIRKLESPRLVGGSLLALSEEPYVFEGLELMHLVARYPPIETGRIGEPSAAALAAFMKPLAEYWLDSTEHLPGSQFGGVDSGYTPEPLTASAFIADCLRAAGWSYSNERIAALYDRVARAVLRDFEQDTDDQGSTPLAPPNTKGGGK